MAYRLAWTTSHPEASVQKRAFAPLIFVHVRYALTRRPTTLSATVVSAGGGAGTSPRRRSARVLIARPSGVSRPANRGSCAHSSRCPPCRDPCVSYAAPPAVSDGDAPLSDGDGDADVDGG